MNHDDTIYLTCVIDPSDLAALTDALEEHDATCELELSIARLEARKRIGAGE